MNRTKVLEQRVDLLEKLVASSDVRVVAHIVSPKRGIDDAKRGVEVKSLCGTVIAGDSPDDAPVCRDCWNLNVPRQQEEARGWINTARDKGKTEGVLTGRADSMREIREAAERRASELAAAS